MSHIPAPKYLAALLLFLTVVGVGTVWLLIRANGYQILTNPVRFVQTGVVSVTVHPVRDTRVTINGVVQPSAQFTFPDLLPGRYTVRLENEGFTSWESTLVLRRGEAKYLDSAVLFYTQPIKEPVPVRDQDRLSRLLANRAPTDAAISLSGGEIWANSKLVTRYSTPVTKAYWLIPEKQLVVEVDNSLRALEVDGSHDVTLLELPADEDAQFIPIAGGSKILVKIADTLSLYEVTASLSLVPLPSF